MISKLSKECGLQLIKLSMVDMSSVGIAVPKVTPSQTMLQMPKIKAINPMKNIATDNKASLTAKTINSTGKRLVPKLAFIGYAQEEQLIRGIRQARKVRRLFNSPSGMPTESPITEETPEQHMMPAVPNMLKPIQQINTIKDYIKSGTESPAMPVQWDLTTADKIDQAFKSVQSEASSTNIDPGFHPGQFGALE